MNINPEIKKLIENLELHEVEGKPGLFAKNLEEKDANNKIGATAFIDFRRTDKGRRFYTIEGVEGVIDREDDVNLIPILQYFKTERDKILNIDNLPAKQSKNKLIIGSCDAAAAQYGIPKELANLFFMTMNDGLYIKNPGLLYLGAKKGYSRIEVISQFNEKNNEWESECKIYPKLSKEVIESIGKLTPEMQKTSWNFLTNPTNGTGRASKDNVKMASMHVFLKEMSQTRAMNRALRAFTGYGGVSYEEKEEAVLEKQE